MNHQLPKRRFRGAIALLPLILFPTLAVFAQENPGEAVPEPAMIEPDLIEFVDAEYPPAALKDGIEGSVLLELLVNESGGVDSVSLAQSLEPSLDAAATAAARRFRFSPARIGDEPVAVMLLFEYSFSIREQARRVTEYVNFRGRLRELGTKDPVAYATVVVAFPDSSAGAELDIPWSAYLERIGAFAGQFIEEGSLVALTDSLGRFEFKSLPPGPFTVSFPNAGYEMIRENENLGRDELLDGEYSLPRTHYDEYEIVVYGKTERKEVTRQRLSLVEVERLPGFGGDAIKSVQALPGVARPPFVSGEIVVRGSHQEDTRYYLDGIEIPLLFHYGGLKSTYNSRALSAIDLYPGGFNASYGGCLGGVVEITGRPGRPDRWRHSIDASLLDAGFLSEGPIGDKLTLTMSGRRSYIGEVAQPVLDSADNFKMAAVPYYWDIVARLDYARSADSRFFLTSFGAKDKMELLFNGENAGSSEVNAATDAIGMSSFFNRVIFGHDWDFGDRWANRLRLALGVDHYEGNLFGYFNYESDSWNYTVRDELSYELSSDLLAVAGLDLAWYPLKYKVQAAGQEKSDQDKTFGDFGAYAKLEYRLGDLLLIPGYRYQYFKELAEGHHDLRLSGRWGLNERHTLTGSAGSYSQSPVPRGQSVDPIYGNPALPPTTAKHYTLGDEMTFGDLLSLKVEGYYNTQQAIPFETDSLGLNFLPEAEARMYGVELMLRRAQGNRFFGWLSYSWSRSERRFPRKPDFGIAGDWNPENWVLSIYDQTHHFEAVGSWNLGSKWSTGLRMRYVTGNPDTPYLGYTSDQYEWNGDSGEYLGLMGSYRSERQDPFFQVDWRVDKKFVYRNWIMSVYLDLQNLSYFFYNSPELYHYNFDYSERSTVGGIFLPTLGFRADF